MATLINIKLLNAKTTSWHPGDTILGEVHLRSPNVQADVQSVSICLKGKTKARYRRNNGQNTTTYRSKVSIFRLSQVLFQGPFTLSPGNMSWPFEFVIPQDCRWAVGDKYGSYGYFDSSNQQPLPPTFMAEAFHKQCEIEYALEAVMATNKTFARNKEILLPLHIVPTRTLEVTNYNRVSLPHLFSFQTLHLDPEIKDRNLTFKEKMRTAFKSESLPMSTFSVKLEIPEAATLRGSVDPVMYLEHNLQRSTATNIPVVDLVSFQLSLKYDIYIQTSGTWSGSQIHDWSNGRDIGSWAGRVPLSERFEVSSLFRNGLKLIASVPPSFKTFNVAVVYRWKVKYTVECATKKMQAEHSTGCIILGPEASAPIASVSIPQIEAAPPPFEAEEQLPAYSKQGAAVVV